MNQPSPFQQHHDLPEVLGWYLLVLGDFLHLHGATKFVTVDELG
jgi:hypothetical protein